MTEKPKRPAGLFSLKDLQGMEVADDEETFPEPSMEPATIGTGEMPPAEMADAIRRARELHPGSGAHDVVFEDPEPDPIESFDDDVAVPEVAEGSPYSEYDTADSAVVLQAAASALKSEGKTSRKLLLVGLPLLVVGALAAVLLVLASPPGMLKAEFPVQEVALESHTSASPELVIALIPVPVVEEPEPEPEPSRHHRSEHRRADSDTDLDLF
jgi:hypothetical protein